MSDPSTAVNGMLSFDALVASTAPESGWFHSGDLATVDAEGFITIVDCKKDMIKTGGENVASREVDEIIDGLTPVSEVAVVGQAHPRRVNKVPKRVVFADALPKNPSDKSLKLGLRLLRFRAGILAR